MEHNLKTIARTENCRVDHCTCGSVHISVGGMTVRVNEGSARELRDALVRALAEIDAATTVAPGPQVRMLRPVDDEDEDEGGSNLH